jgi:hypothetical protein
MCYIEAGDVIVRYCWLLTYIQVELQAYDAAADMMMGDDEELQEEGMEDTGF